MWIQCLHLDDHMGVLQDNLHRDGRVELDLATDQMLERDDPALPVVVALRHDALSAPQLDKEVGDVGERDAERCCVPNGRLVVAVFSEGRDEVLPLLDGGADITSLRLACPALRVLARPSSGAGLLRRHHKDFGGSCGVRWCPRHRAGRFIDILSKSVLVTEVDVIELPVDHDCDERVPVLFGVTRSKFQGGRKVK